MSTIRVSYSLDPDQDLRFVRPDLGPKIDTTEITKNQQCKISQHAKSYAEYCLCSAIKNETDKAQLFKLNWIFFFQDFVEVLSIPAS